MTLTNASRVIHADEYRREPWRNGGGWTREIARSPAPVSPVASDWDWRLSIAEVEQDGPFSRFPGVERELVLLSGEGMRLHIEGGPPQELLPPHGRRRFAGEAAVQAELMNGPTVDFNLMWRRDRVQAELWHRPLVGGMVVFVEPETTWALHLLAGRADFEAETDLPGLCTGDTALLVSGGRRERFRLEGAGEALLIRLAPLA